jgi:hypothetical protein
MIEFVVNRSVSLAATLVALALSAGALALFGPGEFEHRHDVGLDRHSHSHVHAGPHRHDHGPASPPAAPAAPVDPDREGDEPEERYVSAPGPALGDTVAALDRFHAPGPVGHIARERRTGRTRVRRDRRAPPRGPPA